MAQHLGSPVKCKRSALGEARTPLHLLFLSFQKTKKESLMWSANFMEWQFLP